MYGNRPTILSVLAADAYLERRAPQAAAPAPAPVAEVVTEIVPAAPAQPVAEQLRRRLFRRNRVAA
ncbi:hypothetical protein ACFFKU_15535 [Kineococcus gynurae]|uniref:Uncharacterized protein n=1 Tax=Kineococcus gynurae TaxID=452979 RepID=A0ABV5LT77_9ACTN